MLYTNLKEHILKAKKCINFKYKNDENKEYKEPDFKFSKVI